MAGASRRVKNAGDPAGKNPTAICVYTLGGTRTGVAEISNDIFFNMAKSTFLPLNLTAMVRTQIVFGRNFITDFYLGEVTYL